jgi:hypothetical protein
MASAAYKDSTAKKDNTKTSVFWLAYPTTNRSTTLGDALTALYYLPANYKLLVLGKNSAGDIMRIAACKDIMDRIQLQTETGLPKEVSPSSFIHIYDDSTPEAVRALHGSRITVSKGAKTPLKSSTTGRFTVSAGNPQALASAAHRVARAAA